nr:primosomal protein N' [Candidatus Gracilibacteria bacterium]
FCTEHLKTLTEEQDKALEKLFQVPISLLHGVTGSGKTEIFLHFISKIWQNNPQQQFLVLVPEISLTDQLVNYFQKVFPASCSVMHSKITPQEKDLLWSKIALGHPQIVIGARSALFLPYQNLAAIIMDEEHEWTYVSNQNPYYHGQWIARHLIQKHPSCKLILASATPDFKDYYQARHQEIQLVELKKRVTNKPLPQIQIVDLKVEFQRQNFSPLSLILQEKIQKTLARQEQVILFLNKRGFNRAWQCRKCGEFYSCPKCEIPFTYHFSPSQNFGKMICHHCGSVKTPPTRCPNCQDPNFQIKGFGTQKLENELQNLFPQARIFRADRDTTSNKDHFSPIYETFKKGEGDILIGTQMIAKGLDLEKVSLVGIISADDGLNMPDFRAGERVFQLLTQVAGRAGRHHTRGEVILQTFNPHHPLFLSIQKNDYQGFYQSEMSIRQELNYPPFQEVIKLVITGDSKENTYHSAQNLCQSIQQKYPQLIIQCAPAWVPKRNNRYYWHLIIRGTNLSDFKIALPPQVSLIRDPILWC